MDNTIEMLTKLMDATALRQKVLSNNLANANTPGYLRKDVKFSNALAEAVDSGRLDQIQQVNPEVTVDEDAVVDARGNSVSIQKEMGEIAQNELLYNFAAEMTSHKFSSLRRAIKETK
jgi:flagellar basal-body rod protein FlgB